MTSPAKHVPLIATRIIQRTVVLMLATVLLVPGVSLANIEFPPGSEFQSAIEPDADIKESAGMPPTFVEAASLSPTMPEPPHVTAVSIAPASTFAVPLKTLRPDRRSPAHAASGPVNDVPRDLNASSEGNDAGPSGEGPAPNTDLWQRIRAGFAMPDLQSKLVTQRENEYAHRPQMVKLLVERSRRYLYHIVEEIEKRGMPTELALLPMVESAFNPMAYSRAHASGLWQFIPSTGRVYNLEQNWWYDARRDVVASTSAALEYLQKIYEMHGHWHLALASYNFGEWGVARMVERNRRVGLPMNFSNLRLPNETRHYVPRLQALKNIIANPEKFGIELDPIPNAPYFATVTLTRNIDLDLAARLAELPLDELIALNPGHNRPVVTSSKTPTLVLPADHLDSFIANLASYDKPHSAWQIYGAVRGERLEEIAGKHKISVDLLRQVNGIRGSGRLQTDAQLLVPTGASAAGSVPGLFKSPATISAEFAPRALSHLVKAGETWQGIAGRYRVRVQDLQSWNGGGTLIAGQSLTIQKSSAAPARAPAPKTVNASRPNASGDATPTPNPSTPVSVAKR
ncbi:MAG: transglycosylase SLT domain-containing protein [Burkholderiales bacterium]